MRKNKSLTLFGISILIAGCSTVNSLKINTTLVARGSNGQHMEMAYSYRGSRVLAVVTRPQYLRSQFGYEASGGQDVSGHLTLITSESRKDITRSRCWYDIREDGVHKYPFGNVSLGAISNFVSTPDDFNFSNFTAWQKH